MKVQLTNQLKQHIAQSLYQARLDKGYSLPEACERLNMAEDLLTAYETGKISPPGQVLAQILEMYSKNPLLFFHELDEMFQIFNQEKL